MLYACKYSNQWTVKTLGVNHFKWFNRCVVLAFPYILAFVLSLSFGVFVSSAKAETLNDALAAAYHHNPQLTAEQARLRAIDEGVAQAQSGYRPNVDLNAEVGSLRTDTKPRSLADGRTSPYGYSVTLNQPLFRGFRTVNSIRAAKADVQAGRASLRNVEQVVLQDAVTSYVNVVREQAILRLRENNLRVLSKQLTATQDRFSVGEVTKTDIAQSRARRSEAASALNLAQANLNTAKAEFARIVGHMPVRLHHPGTINKHLPRSQNHAIDIGLSEHPLIDQSIYAEKAARHNVDVVSGERLPEVNLEAQYSQNFDSSILTNESERSSVMARARVPLYQSGAVYARIRQAKQIVLQRRAELSQSRLQVRASIISAWGQLLAVRAQIQSNNEVVRANRTALAGVKEEEKVGQRTILDVLDAEQELLNSQVNLATAQRDLVVAEYNLLSSLGRLNVSTLPVAAAVYEPEINYQDVDRRWRGADINEPDLDERSVLHWDNFILHRRDEY